jgi:hypothetical protein
MHADVIQCLGWHASLNDDAQVHLYAHFELANSDLWQVRSGICQRQLEDVMIHSRMNEDNLCMHAGV